MVLDSYNSNYKELTIGKLKLRIGAKTAYQLEGKALKTLPVYLTDGLSWTKVN